MTKKIETKAAKVEHVFSIRNGSKAARMEGWIWFGCSCGASGSKADDVAGARADHREHVRMAVAKEKAERVTAAADPLYRAALAVIHANIYDGSREMNALRDAVAVAECR